MSIITNHKESTFGVGDVVKVHQKVQDGEKTRIQLFEGMVIRIKGRDTGRSFTVRRIGAQKVGIEMVFPLESPTVDKVEVLRRGVEGVRRSKLYYVRGKSSREIEKIYSRAAGKNKQNMVKKVSKKAEVKKNVVAKKAVVKKVASKKKTTSKK